ncbi:MAG: M15 family metallopeptidase [Candidatus Deferrimicrobiaceae bacterium]
MSEFGTAAGWAAFQRRRGLIADGVPGPQTLAEVERMESELITAALPAPSRFHLSDRSIDRLAGVHVDLQSVVHYAIGVSTVDFGITLTGGVRDEHTQRRLMREGKSRTMNSRHRTGHAIDVFAVRDGRADWSIKTALQVHDAFAAAGRALGVSLRWGGDWDGDGAWRDERFLDAFHHELPRGLYGNTAESKAPSAVRWLANQGITPA